MIRLILLALTFVSVSLFSAHGQSREVYTIHGIAVDERAPTVAEAQQKAFARAKLVGARLLIERFTLPEDRAAATDRDTGSGVGSRVDCDGASIWLALNAPQNLGALNLHPRYHNVWQFMGRSERLCG